MSDACLIHTAPQPLAIGLTDEAAEIAQNIRLIVGTPAYSVRLDCAFAGDGSYIDSPLPFATATRIAELTQAIERYEPRVRVLGMTFEPNPDEAVNGQVWPRVRYTRKES